MSSENKLEAIALFTALTGENAVIAEQYLEACDYDVTEAFNTFSAVGPPTAEMPSTQTFGAGASTSSASPLPEAYDQEAADAAMAAALAEDDKASGYEYSNGASGAGGVRSNERIVTSGFSSFTKQQQAAARPSPRSTGGRGAHRDASRDQKVAYEAQHGMRAPEDYKTARMVDSFDGPPFGLPPLPRQFPGFRGGSLHSGDGGGLGGPGLASANDLERALLGAGLGGGGGLMMGGMMGPSPLVVDVPDSEWMFPLPKGAKQLNCGGDVAVARSKAREEKKWVLVCLAAMDLFDSHRLNRDLWGNESLLELIEASFVFWHRTTSSPQGQAFKQLYQVNEAELPLIAILGPTGAKVFSFTGCMPAPDLATALAEFLDANDLESSDAVKLKVRKGSNADALSSLAGAEAAQPSSVDEADGGMSEEDRSLAEAIRLSMLYGDNGEGEADSASSGAGADTIANDSTSVDALSSRLAQQSLSTKESTSAPPLPLPVPPSVTGTSSAAAGDRTLPVETDDDATAPPALSEDHLPVGWETALAAEPPKGAAGSTRVQLRLASGKTAVRRFMLTDSIACLFAACVEAMPEARLTPFTLQTPIAAQVKLLDVSNDPISAHDLANAKVIMSWI